VAKLLHLPLTSKYPDKLVTFCTVGIPTFSPASGRLCSAAHGSGRALFAQSETTMGAMSRLFFKPGAGVGTIAKLLIAG